MNRAIVALVIVGGALIYSRRASATVDPQPGNWFDPRAYLPVINASPSPQTYNPTLWNTDPFSGWVNDIPMMEEPSMWGQFQFLPESSVDMRDTSVVIDEATGSVIPIQYKQSSAREYMANLTAFLSVIRNIESGNNYNALVDNVGSVTDWAPNYEDHPALRGWRGVTRPDGRISTAAGGYQIVRSTWNELRTRGTPLPDFSPPSQDIAAVALMQLPWRQGAYSDVISGNFDIAVRKLASEWEAFSRILKGTYTYSLPQIKQMYADAGGILKGETIA